MDPRLVVAAQNAIGFMPDAEGLALFAAARDRADRGPLLEVGTYCGKSAIYLGAAAGECGSILYTVDHHHGSEENQAGWEHHDQRLVNSETGQLDTLPWFRRTIAAAELDDTVVAVIGSSTTVATHWTTQLAMVFIDGGHALDVAKADYEAWSPKIIPEGLLAFHDVFEDPKDGGQAPYEVYCQALNEGWSLLSATGSLRVLERE